MYFLFMNSLHLLLHIALVGRDKKTARNLQLASAPFANLIRTNDCVWDQLYEQYGLKCWWHFCKRSGTSLRPLKWLYRHMPDIPFRSYFFYNLTHCAARANNLKVVEFLAEECDPEIMYEIDIIVAACKSGNYDLFKYCVVYGTDDFDEDEYNDVLTVAVKVKNIDIIQYIMSEFISYPSRAHHFDNETFKEACIGGDVSIVRYLRRFFPDFVDWDLEIFNEAAARGHVDVVRFLYEEKITREQLGENALTLAISRGHLECVKFLVDVGAHCRNHCVRNAVIEGNLEMIKYLYENKTRVKVSEDIIGSGTSPPLLSDNLIFEALVWGHKNMVVFLRENLNATFNYVEPYVYDIIAEGHVDMLLYVFDEGLVDAQKVSFDRTFLAAANASRPNMIPHLYAQMKIHRTPEYCNEVVHKVLLKLMERDVGDNLDFLCKTEEVVNYNKRRRIAEDEESGSGGSGSGGSGSGGSGSGGSGGSGSGGSGSGGSGGSGDRPENLIKYTQE